MTTTKNSYVVCYWTRILFNIQNCKFGNNSVEMEIKMNFKNWKPWTFIRIGLNISSVQWQNELFPIGLWFTWPLEMQMCCADQCILLF